MTCFRIPGGILDITPNFKPGDLPPENAGYLEWHEWADVQYKAGIRTVQCPMCCKWKTPQELSDQTLTYTARTSRGKPVMLEAKLCTKCTPPRDKES